MLGGLGSDLGQPHTQSPAPTGPECGVGRGSGQVAAGVAELGPAGSGRLHLGPVLCGQAMPPLRGCGKLCTQPLQAAGPMLHTYTRAPCPGPLTAQPACNARVRSAGGSAGDGRGEHGARLGVITGPAEQEVSLRAGKDPRRYPLPTSS